MLVANIYISFKFSVIFNIFTCIIMHLQIFVGNSDRNTTRKQLLCSEILTTRLRLIVQEHHGSCCMRVEIYGLPLTRGKFHFMHMMPYSTSLFLYPISEHGFSLRYVIPLKRNPYLSNNAKRDYLSPRYNTRIGDQFTSIQRGICRQ